MNSNGQFCTKLIHCGNNNIANPEDQIEKNIFFMPMGLFALANALRENGIDAEIISSDVEKNKSIQEILDFNALDAVGFDCHWANQSLAVLDTAELIKKIKPRVFIFLGGFTASLFAEEIMSTYSQIDAIIRGDAEIPIVKLCLALYEEKLCNKNNEVINTGRIQSLSNVPNLVWRGNNNEVRLNDFSYLATQEELDKLDFASLDLLRNWEYYRKRSIYWTKFAPFNFAPFNFAPLFFLEVGRGCQHGCIFCGGNCEAQRRINNRKRIVYRSVDSVIVTIRKAISFGFRMFFSDFEFKGGDDWYIELFSRIKKEKLDIDYVYSCWSLTSKALIDALSESFKRVFVQISPETSSMELRKKNKGLLYTNDELEECISYIGTKNNVKAQLYFGYFLAFEKRETVLGTIEYILQLLINFPDLLEIGYMPFSTDPGSSLFFYPERYDIDIAVHNFQDYIRCIREAYVEKKLSCPDMRLFKPKGISKRAAIELERKIELLNYLFTSHRQSISYILKKSGNPNVIIKFLREADLPVTYDFSEKIRDMLLATCGENGITDVHLVETMNVEFEKQKKSKKRVFKARPQIWLDCKTENSNQENSKELLYG